MTRGKTSVELVYQVLFSSQQLTVISEDVEIFLCFYVEISRQVRQRTRVLFSLRFNTSSPTRVEPSVLLAAMGLKVSKITALCK